MLKQDVLPFFRSWLDNPLRVSAVAPSSPQLADLITREIKADDAPVLELGPGTGVFTRALLRRGVPERDLLLVEADAQFFALLKKRFPEATVLHMNATETRRLSHDLTLGATISGLPLLSMAPRTVLQILAGAFSYLRDDGAFYQFTYGFRCPVSDRILKRLGLSAERIGGVIANVPPASVYRIARR